MNAPHRRNACPGLSTPMPTGDGLLVRMLPTQRIPLDAFAALCDAAREHGNGTIEVTARGSLQVRGLTPRSALLFADEIAALRIAADGVPVITDPLADDSIGMIDVHDLAKKLRQAIADAHLTLAPKVSVIVDGGNLLHLDTLSADVRLRVIETAEGPRIHSALGGDAATAVTLGSADTDAIADIVVRLLQVLATDGTARAADIVRRDGVDPFRTAVGHRLDPVTPLPPRPPAEPVGRHPLNDGAFALGVALAFGHTHADALAELAGIAAANGACCVRPAPGRALLFTGLSAAAADTVAGAAAKLGFIVQADDPRRRIAACPGAPACTSGLIPARTLAADIAKRLRLTGDGIAAHVSGCAKGCAHPASCALTVVGTAQGCGIVRDDSARAAPRYYVDSADLTAELARLAAEEFGYG